MGTMRYLALTVLVWGCYHPNPQGGTCTTTADCPARGPNQGVVSPAAGAAKIIYK